MIRLSAATRLSGLITTIGAEERRKNRGLIVGVLGDYGIRQVNWLRTGLEKSKCVGRVQIDDRPFSTGFLVAGELIGAQFADTPLFITVNHPNSPLSSDAAALVVFEGLFDDASASAQVEISDILWSSDELLAALCVLSAFPGDVRGLRAAAALPAVQSEKSWIIGYPKGGNLAVSIEDNQMLAIVEPQLHYRTPTTQGSSGSPVFNSHWEVVAMHQGVGVDPSVEYDYNWGILLDTILNKSAEALKLTKPPKLPTDRPGPASSEEPHAFLSAFISYNNKDRQFAERLYTSLQIRGVRCWWDQKNMVPGEKIDEALKRGIRKYDRVLLCCSESSLGQSWWVENELELAFARERDAQRANAAVQPIVVPLDVDGFMFQWDGAKAEQLKSRSAVDFTSWRNPNGFDEAVGQLMRALQPRESEGEELK